LSLYYLRARYYNPATGRFLSRDPLDGNTIDPQSLHKYLYAGGDPINRIDPSGRMDGTTAGPMPRAGTDYATLVLNVSLATTASVVAVACAIEVNHAYDALKVEGVALFKVDLPVMPDPLKCGANSKCIPYEEAIQQAMEEVQTRYKAMLMDTNCLYPFKPGKNPSRPRAGTWPGHQYWFAEQENEAQQALKAAIQAAEGAGCPIPPDAEYWANIPPPVCPAGRIPF
jgi:uncharacterized protein RhaS with RHS repeats